MTNDWLIDFLQWKKEKKVNIYSVLIDVYSNSTRSLKLFSNEIFKLDNLRNAAKMDEVAFTLFSTV